MPCAQSWGKADVLPRPVRLRESIRAARLHGIFPFHTPTGLPAMTLDITLTLIAIFALLIFAAFFAGAETALTAVSKVRMYHLASEGSARAKQVLSLIANRERLIGALLLGNTFFNILASSLPPSIALTLFPQPPLVISPSF